VNPYPIQGKYAILDETTVLAIEQCGALNPANANEHCNRIKGHVEAGSLKHGIIPNIKTGMKTDSVVFWD
jgi:hypothetical protein